MPEIILTVLKLKNWFFCLEGVGRVTIGRILVDSALLLLLAVDVFSQKSTRVIVVDSLSFEVLPAVFIRVKNGNTSFMADPNGIATIKTKPTDTLLISHIGYYEVTIPLFFEEEAIMVRMRPKITLLDEVVISSRKLYPNELNPRVSKAPKTRTVIGSLSQPWEYFNKREKEKRKLVKLMQENDRIKTYMEVITDPTVKDELMEDYEVEEEAYYAILAKFNQKKLPVIYSNDSQQILDALHEFFEKETD